MSIEKRFHLWKVKFIKKEYCYMEQVIREWLELAEMDYGVAMHLFEN